MISELSLFERWTDARKIIPGKHYSGFTAIVEHKSGDLYLCTYKFEETSFVFKEKIDKHSTVHSSTNGIDISEIWRYRFLKDV